MVVVVVVAVAVEWRASKGFTNLSEPVQPR
jgi:hypothetical protein